MTQRELDALRVCGLDLANGPDYTVYLDGRIVANPNWKPAPDEPNA